MRFSVEINSVSAADLGTNVPHSSRERDFGARYNCSTAGGKVKDSREFFHRLFHYQPSR